jgi:hypothetical protein
MSTLLTHITLNTGHTVALPRPDGDALDALALHLGAADDLGTVHPKFRGWNVDPAFEPGLGAAAFSVRFGAIPAVECMACWNDAEAERAWTSIENLYLDMSDSRAEMMAAKALPERPTKTPWLAAVLLPTIVVVPFAPVAGNIGELERLVAWLLMDKDQPST